MHFPLPQRELAIITDPESVRCVPSVLQVSWCALKSARGQTVDLDRLTKTQFLISPAPVAVPPAAPVATAPQFDAIMDQTMQRTLPRIRERIAQLTRARFGNPGFGPDFGGDAA